MQTTTQMGTISEALQNRISREKLQDFLARFGANEGAHFYLISADILPNDVSSEERKNLIESYQSREDYEDLLEEFEIFMEEKRAQEQAQQMQENSQDSKQNLQHNLHFELNEEELFCFLLEHKNTERLKLLDIALYDFYYHSFLKSSFVGDYIILQCTQENTESKIIELNKYYSRSATLTNLQYLDDDELLEALQFLECYMYYLEIHAYSNMPKDNLRAQIKTLYPKISNYASLLEKLRGLQEVDFTHMRPYDIKACLNECQIFIRYFKEKLKVKDNEIATRSFLDNVNKTSFYEYLDS